LFKSIFSCSAVSLVIIAVRAIIGILFAYSVPMVRISLVVSMPSISGIIRSIKIISYLGSPLCTRLTASDPFDKPSACILYSSSIPCATAKFGGKSSTTSAFILLKSGGSPLSPVSSFFFNLRAASTVSAGYLSRISLFNIESIRRVSMGLDKKPSKPFARKISSCPTKALAVSAIMGFL